MSVKELQKYTYFSKYARHNKEANRRETWEEAVDRMKQMHLRKYPQVADEINWAFEYVRDQKVLGSQRALQYGGKPIEDKNARIYNCISSYCDRLRFFQESFNLLLCGCGTGFSVQKHHIAKLPKFSVNRTTPSSELPTKTYIIPDTIEGWSDALGVLLSSYFENPVFPEYANCNVEFDKSLIREKGSVLSSGAGKAPGPEPLINTLEKVRALLDLCIRNGQQRLRPIDAYDIVMHASDAVLSGGVRRCLSVGTKVLVKEVGYKNIEDVRIGDMVSTMNGYRPVTNIFDQGKQETVSIKHANGTLICTPNHRIAVLKNYKGEYDWKRADELNDKDVLILPKNVDTGSEDVNLPKWSYNKSLHSTTCKEITIPDFDKDIAYFLGLFLGDGYVFLKNHSGSLSVAVAADHKKIADKVKEQIERFGVNAQITGPWEDDNCFKVICKSKQLAKYMYDNFKQPKSVIRIPTCIWNSSALHKLAFLQGLLDSDGCVKTRPQQAVTTVYKEFAKDIQTLYATLGMASTVKKLCIDAKYPERQQKYAVIILDDRVKRTFNELNNEIGEKRYLLSSKYRRLQPSIPMEFVNKPYPKNWYTKVCSSNTSIPIATIEDFFGDVNYTPVRIISVIPNSTVQTYDIEVEDQHCFVAEQILVHNSATICVFSDDDEEMLKAKTGNWYYDNPQRARSNNSVMLIRGQVSRERFMEIIHSVKQFGEPGFVWSDSTEFIVNPCVVGDTVVATADGLRLATDLVDKQFVARVDGQNHLSTTKGFWKTGSKKILNLELSSGRELKVTPNHKILTTEGWKEADEINYDDEIIINNQRTLEITHSDMDFAKGYCLGNAITYEKTLSKNDLIGSYCYLSGLIAGYFDANGSLNSFKNNLAFIESFSVNKSNLRNIQIGLNSLGIYSKITECQAGHELIVSCDNIERFFEVIPVKNKDKWQKIDRIVAERKRMPNRTHFVDKLVKKTLESEQDVYDCTVPEVSAFDANGVYVHNCVEIGMYPVDEVTHETGWQACNLSEINGKMIKSREDFCMAAIAASIIGTLQAGYDRFSYLGEVSERIVRREALLGVSITGMMDSPDVLFNPEYQRMAAELVSNTNAIIAEKIGINPAARTTCIKPSGCLCADTKIKTSQGDMSLLEIFKEQGYDFDTIKNMSDTWLEIKNPLIIMNENNEPEKAVKLYVNGNIHVYEIPLEDGTLVKATPWHKFKLADGSWKRADELEAGDDIVAY